MEFEPSIGLEIHAELRTRSKIFCNCLNQFGAEPNTNVCPVCMGLPGARPLLNKKAVEYAVRTGLALNCTIAEFCRMDRKNYFYPDLPKAYQISQAEIPLCSNGWIEILHDDSIRRIGIERIHIEEDAGKLVHDAGDDTLIDYNRCGVPLIEIVTRPDMHSAKEAHCLLTSLRSILQFIDVSDCRMEEGSIRCDVNVSLSTPGSTVLGTRVEMKNINSFSGALRAIEYEIRRQSDLLTNGQTIQQETRKWDDSRGVSFVMRTKENAADYRFFPDPDFRTLHIPQELIDNQYKTLPELPTQKLIRYTIEYSIPQTEAEIIAFNVQKSDLFDRSVSLNKCTPRSLCNWIIGDITKYLNDNNKQLSDSVITPESLTELAACVENRYISSSSGKTVLNELLLHGGNVQEIINDLGLVQNSSEDFLNSIIDQIISENSKSVSDYKSGKTKAFGYLVGQCMRISNGTADPEAVRKILNNKLNDLEA